MRLKIFILIFAFLSFTRLVQAQGLIPCSGIDCTFCDLLRLVENLINFALYYIAVPAVVIMIIYGGFTIMTAGDDSKKVSDGKGIIQAAVIGLLVAFGAWLIISEIIQVVSGGSFVPWQWGSVSSFCQ
ncbi:hypothetical protein HZC33_02670 [Candidatus Wolfebacteria bacterium]|nr:hypothetical protein [Candidatus Wolfebacteria bacterium]